LAQVVKCLLCRFEAPSSNPRPTKKKKLFVYLFILCGTGAELRTSTLSHSTSPFFVKGLAWAGLKSQFSWSLPTE
jgi:hypothetical protein